MSDYVHRCSPDPYPVAIEGPDPEGRYAIVCLGCGLVLTASTSREELFADL